jgi:hypothetical protein
MVILARRLTSYTSQPSNVLPDPLHIAAFAGTSLSDANDTLVCMNFDDA